MSHNPLTAVVRKLRSRSTLDSADEGAILALQCNMRTAEAGAYLVREGDEPQHCCILVSGFAYRHKVAGDGQRQILSIHMSGDFVDLQNMFLDVSDHNVQALTRSEVAFVPRSAMRALIERHPNIARALWAESLVDGSIFREWVVNVGRRPALARIAHLLCEFAMRVESAGLAQGTRFELPMTQEQIADAAGLTPVHVNRVLQELGRLGLIERIKRSVSIPDWERLRQIGDFNARYLHLEPSQRTQATA